MSDDSRLLHPDGMQEAIRAAHIHGDVRRGRLFELDRLNERLLAAKVAEANGVNLDDTEMAERLLHEAMRELEGKP